VAHNSTTVDIQQLLTCINDEQRTARDENTAHDLINHPPILTVMITLGTGLICAAFWATVVLIGSVVMM
jgi:hypothetical protein